MTIARYENYANRIIDKNKNMVVPYYLMASYAYYEEDSPIFSDSYYDELAKTMIENYNVIQHYHKNLISLDDLEAGSYLGTYPRIVKEALKDWRKKVEKKVAI